jgi:hypothetical protein
MSPLNRFAKKSLPELVCRDSYLHKPFSPFQFFDSKVNTFSPATPSPESVDNSVRNPYDVGETPTRCV